MVRRQKVVRGVVVAAFWLAAWEVAALVVAKDILLVSPLAAARTLVTLAGTLGFWQTVAYSLLRIGAGFLIAVAAGVALAALAHVHPWVHAVLSPAIRAIRSIPVVSFIILVLIWASSSVLSTTIAGLMVLPIVYTNIDQGIAGRDPKLAAMARVFGFTRSRRWWAVTLPGVYPYLRAACETGLGLAWKAGVSAEVIGLPDGSIGERLYQAKLFLSTADLFAWTAVVVALSFGAEKLVLWLLGRGERALAGVGRRDPRVGPRRPPSGIGPSAGGGRPSVGGAGPSAGGAEASAGGAEASAGGPGSSVGGAGPSAGGPGPSVGGAGPSVGGAGPAVDGGGPPVGADPSPGVELAFTDVSFAYGDHVVLEHMDVTLPRGHTLHLTGPNGVGKTTTLNLFLGLLEPTSGLVEGRPATTAAVFQEDRLLDHLDALANVRLGSRAPLAGDAIAVELAALGLPEEAWRRPAGQLSGGQRRRVAIARALLADAELTTLDEPFTGLDQNSLPGIAAHVAERLEGKTTVLVAHDLADASPFRAQPGRLRVVKIASSPSG